MQTNESQLYQTVKGTLEGAKDLSSVALGGVVHVVADTTAHACKATEEVSEDLTSMTQTVVVNAIKGFQGIAAALVAAALENVRGSIQGAALAGQDLGDLSKQAAKGFIQGASEVGDELGLATKHAAIGFIHGSAEVGQELGKVLKQGALSALQGTGEVTRELGALARSNALGAIEGGAQASLALENALLVAAKAFARGLTEIKAERAAEPVTRACDPTPAGPPPASPPVVPTATYAEIPPVVLEKPVSGKAKASGN